MDLRQAQLRLAADLTAIYDDREAATIADWVMEHLTGQKKIDRLLRSAIPLSPATEKQYENYRAQLLAHRPIQYVLHESWFAGLKFYVDEHVLIPRPETEELVEWVVATISDSSPHSATISASTPTPASPLLDVGTGSGCIAISMAKRLPGLAIHAADVSEGALRVAHRNAAQLQAAVTFHQLDFLDRGAWSYLPPMRWLVSNPPYIPLRERPAMPRHVAEAEPAAALFVPDADPLVFYRALADFTKQKLLPGGAIFAETHEDFSADAAGLFKAAGLDDVVVRKDMQGKHRMIRASARPAT